MLVLSFSGKHRYIYLYINTFPLPFPNSIGPFHKMYPQYYKSECRFIYKCTFQDINISNFSGNFTLAAKLKLPASKYIQIFLSGSTTKTKNFLCVSKNWHKNKVPTLRINFYPRVSSISQTICICEKYSLRSIFL